MTTDEVSDAAAISTIIYAKVSMRLAVLVLMTRDPTRYRTYFPGLEIVAP